MIAIVFSEEIGFWSKFVFWFAVANTAATILFTVVVIVGGCFDLKYLFDALNAEPHADADDDGTSGPPHDAGRG